MNYLEVIALEPEWVRGELEAGNPKQDLRLWSSTLFFAINEASWDLSEVKSWCQHCLISSPRDEGNDSGEEYATGAESYTNRYYCLGMAKIDSALWHSPSVAVLVLQIKAIALIWEQLVAYHTSCGQIELLVSLLLKQIN